MWGMAINWYGCGQRIMHSFHENTNHENFSGESEGIFTKFCNQLKYPAILHVSLNMIRVFQTVQHCIYVGNNYCKPCTELTGRWCSGRWCGDDPLYHYCWCTLILQYCRHIVEVHCTCIQSDVINQHTSTSTSSLLRLLSDLQVGEDRVY